MIGRSFETAVEVLPIEDCPACCGNGEIFIERLYGINAPEPIRARPCAPCHGTGMVPAEWVEHCAQDGCDEVFWAGAGCAHMPDSPLCPDHKPANCRDCVDDHGGLDR